MLKNGYTNTEWQVYRRVLIEDNEEISICSFINEKRECLQINPASKIGILPLWIIGDSSKWER